MSSKIDIDHIITSYLIGKISAFESEKLNEWINASPQNAYQLERLKKLWNEKCNERKTINSSDIKRDVWQKGVEQSPIIQKNKIHPFIHSLFVRKLVAVFVIITIVGILFMMSNNSINSTSFIIEENEHIEKINPSGQKSKIFLSDGSIVWLNANSSISYYKHFSDSARIISLNGEAFFEVKKDTLNPFIVKTKGVNIKVLGTQFNVNSRVSEQEVSVALIEGLVKVFIDNKIDDRNTQFINPGEGIIINCKTNHIQNFAFNLSEKYNPYSCWKDGIMVFNGESYDAFVDKIALWYGIEVQTDGIPSSDWEIRGHFHNESLENIMNTVSYNKEFTYKINRKKLLLNFK